MLTRFEGANVRWLKVFKWNERKRKILPKNIIGFREMRKRETERFLRLTKEKRLIQFEMM